MNRDNNNAEYQPAAVSSAVMAATVLAMAGGQRYLLMPSPIAAAAPAHGLLASRDNPCRPAICLLPDG
jgi:hypothetical protein